MVICNIDRTCATRRTETITCLTSIGGGVALTDLQAEIMSRTAVTVSKWEATPARYKQLLGDCLITGDTASEAQPAWLHSETLGDSTRNFDKGKPYGLLGSRFWAHME